MAEYNKAFVVGGYSEFEESLEPLANALDSGPDAIVREAEPITLAYAVANRQKLNAEAANRIVVGHSFGPMAVECAGIMVVLNGVEPTPLRKSVVGAIRVNMNAKMGRESQVPKFGPLIAAYELVSHPVVAVTTPFKVRHASSLQHLIDGGTAVYPGGRLYLPTENDEFGFGGVEKVERARNNGITAYMLPGYHNQPLAHPNAAAKTIHDILNNVYQPAA